MDLTDFRALLIDCDDVLVDRDSGIWTAVQPLLQNSGGRFDRERVLAEYRQAVVGLAPRQAELGFGGLLCFAHRRLAERLGLSASWEEGMSFARSVAAWSLFEDAPGAMLYLRKFYRLLVYGDRDAEDREALCERLGIDAEDLLSRAGNPLEDTVWLSANHLRPQDVLQISRAPAEPLGAGGLCLIDRGATGTERNCPADFCVSSMADLVAQHQMFLRR
ncbi:HAD family hydrolase [Pseudomonas indica]|uniref:HAD family hydrolase n=1 Tax=Pseudomonas indica TaxID=137658 RepID=UPI000BAB961D|nr:2-haloalkanoic acid dehalogenase [Pseudomonas indica]PAU54341.1 2-haloalkanoic acid dehalogenase [Pseudomonas indica]